MRRFITACSTFVICCLFSISVQAQQAELPVPGIIVNTRCTIIDGYDFDDVLEAARAVDRSSVRGPTLVFLRRPITATDAPANGVIRSFYWQNMQRWANASFVSTMETARLNSRLSCDSANRRFFQNRNVGQGNAYNGGENQQTLIATLSCRIKQGRTIAEVYQGLTALNSPMQAQGDPP